MPFYESTSFFQHNFYIIGIVLAVVNARRVNLPPVRH